MFPARGKDHAPDRQTILVIGASSGIGAAAVRELAGTGARLFIGARRIERLAALAEELGDQVAWRPLDVPDDAGFRAFADAAAERFGQVDALVNNACIVPLSPLPAMKLDEWNRMIDVNVRGVLNGIAAVLPRFVAQGSGHVINVAAVAAHFVMPTAAVYCATNTPYGRSRKGYARSMTRSGRRDLAGRGRHGDGHDISVPEIRQGLATWRKQSLTPDAIGRAIRYALEQPEGVDVNEIVVRPTMADM